MNTRMALNPENRYSAEAVSMLTTFLTSKKKSGKTTKRLSKMWYVQTIPQTTKLPMI